MDFDSLIPQHILELCQFDRLDIELHLAATSVHGRWPKAELWVDGQHVCEDVVQDRGKLQCCLKIDPAQTQSSIALRYQNKTDLDTVVNHRGDILANQSLTIIGFLINDVDIVRNNLIYNIGSYHMWLSPSKKEYFLANGLNVGPTHSLTMTENGEWLCKIFLPVTSGLVSRMQGYEKHAHWLQSGLYEAIHTKIQIVLDLQKQIAACAQSKENS